MKTIFTFILLYIFIPVFSFVIILFMPKLYALLSIVVVVFLDSVIFFKTTIDKKYLFFANHMLLFLIYSVYWKIENVYLLEHIVILFLSILIFLFLHAMSNFIIKKKVPFFCENTDEKSSQYIKNIYSNSINFSLFLIIPEFLIVVFFVLEYLEPYKYIAIWIPIITAIILLFILFRNMLMFKNILDNFLNDKYMYNLKKRLYKGNFDVLLHFSGPDNSFYQVQMWEDTLVNSKQHILLIIRNRKAINMASQSVLNTLFIQKVSDVTYLLPATIKYALFTGNNASNLAFISNKQLRTCFIGHGDSDKSSSSNHATKMYDDVFVAGQAAIDRYKKAKVAIRDEAFKIVGRPQLDYVNRVSKDKSLSSDKITLLFAPTWEGWSEDANYTSIKGFFEQLKSLLNNYPKMRILFRPHPYVGNRLNNIKNLEGEIAQELKKSNLDHKVCIGMDYNLYDCFNLSDIVVTDISSVASDYLASQKPLIISCPDQYKKVDFVRDFPISNASYIWENSKIDLSKIIHEILSGDPLKKNRIKFAHYVLGDLNCNQKDLFNSQLDICYQNAKAAFPIVLDKEDLEFNNEYFKK